MGGFAHLARGGHPLRNSALAHKLAQIPVNFTEYPDLSVALYCLELPPRRSRIACYVTENTNASSQRLWSDTRVINAQREDSHSSSFLHAGGPLKSSMA